MKLSQKKFKLEDLNGGDEKVILANIKKNMVNYNENTMSGYSEKDMVRYGEDDTPKVHRGYSYSIRLPKDRYETINIKIEEQTAPLMTEDELDILWEQGDVWVAFEDCICKGYNVDGNEGVSGKASGIRLVDGNILEI